MGEPAEELLAGRCDGELEGEVLARVTLARFQVRHEQESKRDKGG